MPDEAMFAPLATGDGAKAPPAPHPGSKPVPIVPVPTDAPQCTWRHPEHGPPVAMWPYRDAEGRLVGYAARVEYDGEDGEREKDVLPVAYCRIGGKRSAWRAHALPAPRALYRLPELLADPASPVIVTEGEKKAELVPKLFPGHVGTTSMGGCGRGKTISLGTARRPQGDHMAGSRRAGPPLCGGRGGAGDGGRRSVGRDRCGACGMAAKMGYCGPAARGRRARYARQAAPIGNPMDPSGAKSAGRPSRRQDGDRAARDIVAAAL